MKIDTYKKKGLFKNIKSLYRFQIIDTNTYDVKWVIEMSKLNLLILLWGLLLFLLLIAFLTFAFTPLRNFIPGMSTNADDKREIIELKLKTEKLEEKIDQYSQYYSNINMLLKDSINIHEDYLKPSDIIALDSSYYFPKTSQLETKYRKDFESIILKDETDEKAGRVYVLNNMHLPVEGKPMIVETANLQSKTLKIKAKNDAGIYSILEGVVLAKYLTGKKTHLYILHEDRMTSIYKFEGISEVVQGEKLFKGQLIGVMSENGDEVLSFDLWVGTEAIAAGQFLKY